MKARTLYTWGSSLRIWSLPDLVAHREGASGPFNEGGCLFDVNGDGREDLIMQEGYGIGRLVWLEAPRWNRHEIDSEVEMHDCLAAALHGRRGVLITQRHMQVRFYEPAGPRWRMREIYSFYTASSQTGLAMADIDGDGLRDIVCGNYWIRSPRRFDLPWRLFAINTRSETPESAMMRFAVFAHGLAASQGHRPDGRLLWFERPKDPRQLWRETSLGANVRLVNPHGLARAGGRILAGENNGAASRLIEFDLRGNHQVLAEGHPVIAILPAAGGLLLVGPGGAGYAPRRK